MSYPYGLGPVFLLSVLITGVVTGFVIHELTHFVVGWVMGTVTEAGLMYRIGWRGLPIFAGGYVDHTRRNWASTLAPLVWLLPLLTLPDPHAPLLYLYLLLVFGIAGGGVIVSDIPAAIGMVNPLSEPGINRIVLVDLRRSESPPSD